MSSHFLLRAAKSGLQDSERIKFNRLRSCQTCQADPNKEIYVTKTESGRARWHGVRMCANPWHCPVCAPIIAASRSCELSTAIEKVREEGGSVAMVTLTIPHSYADDLRPLLLSFNKLCREFWAHIRYRGQLKTRKVTKTRIKHQKRNAISFVDVPRSGGLCSDGTTIRVPSYGKSKLVKIQEQHEKEERFLAKDGIKQRYGIFGRIAALECTHGQNGWHPHRHVLVFLENQLTDHQKEELENDLRRLWVGLLRRHDMRVPSGAEVHSLKVDSTDKGAANYVTKWGASAEMTKNHMKQGREGNRTYFDILADYAFSDDEDSKKRDRVLINEFAKAFHRMRQLHWTPGLRSRLLIEEKSDEELIQEETPEIEEERAQEKVKTEEYRPTDHVMLKKRTEKQRVCVDPTVFSYLYHQQLLPEANEVIETEGLHKFEQWLEQHNEIVETLNGILVTKELSKREQWRQKLACYHERTYKLEQVIDDAKEDLFGIAS